MIQLRQIALGACLLSIAGCAMTRELSERGSELGSDISRIASRPIDRKLDLEIVNGREIKANDPHAKLAVMVITDRAMKESVCSGVTLAERAVLTAAHCVFGAKASRVRVSFGAATTAESADVERIVIHDAYDGTPESHADLALLKLARAIPIGYPIHRLHEESDQIASDEVLLVGFGITNERSSDSRVLRKTLKSLKNEIHFKGKIIGVDQRSSNGGFCRGDSGAPVFVKSGGANRILGISSFNVGLEKDSECHTASVAISLPYYSGWIRQHLEAF